MTGLTADLQVLGYVLSAYRCLGVVLVKEGGRGYPPYLDLFLNNARNYVLDTPLVGLFVT